MGMASEMLYIGSFCLRFHCICIINNLSNDPMYSISKAILTMSTNCLYYLRRTNKCDCLFHIFLILRQFFLGFLISENVKQIGKIKHFF